MSAEASCASNDTVIPASASTDDERAGVAVVHHYPLATAGGETAEVAEVAVEQGSTMETSAEEDLSMDDDFRPDDASSYSDYDDQSDASSFLSSLLSSAEDYYWENGRRYHAQGGGRYLLPNDETELDREDMKHHMWMLVTSGRLHLSPIARDPQKILDLGTGTGIWAMQMADLYPSAEVVGTDISPVQPKWVPPNLQFEVDDLEEEWLYKPNSFDLVNVRFMFLAIKDYPAMLEQAYKALKPGGYIEMAELDLNPTPDPEAPYAQKIFEWFKMQDVAIARAGFDMRVAHKFKSMVRDAGFQDVEEHVFEVPWGTWPSEKRQKAIGFWHLEQLKQGLHGIAMASLTRAGWTVSEVEVYLSGLRKEMNDKNYRVLDHGYVVYGRKPLH
ncbi:hypothetical protein B0A49_03243 [Cryomyces minteri]|uniref:Methyltransferase domain-containing protein n=1 Tax=Cryomyces minteri TaxID=331657 RepID=A0A4U0WY31_9PEZI|nr:hypothetical protein B0A49_03243 [Cryomyces minteri]